MADKMGEKSLKKTCHKRSILIDIGAGAAWAELAENCLVISLDRHPLASGNGEEIWGFLDLWTWGSDYHIKDYANHDSMTR